MEFGENRGQRIPIAFLVRSLERGGAETQLAALAAHLDREIFEVAVFCFYRKGALVGELEKAGVRIISLNKAGRWDVIRFLFRLQQEMKTYRPRLIHSFMGPPNLLALLLKLTLRGTRVIWGIRSSRMNLKEYDYTWRVVFALERLFSRFPDGIVANSYAGRDHVADYGFSQRHLAVVPNGIDTRRFQPSPLARDATRSAWNIAPNEHLIGMVGRLDPKKDHATFLHAAALLLKDREDVRFVCVGGDGRLNRGQLEDLARSLGLSQRLIWSRQRDDIPAVFASIDINTLPSAFGEGFPNVVAEGMAVGVPCVVTDVGDSARIVGDLGQVVSPRDPKALAVGWQRILDLSSEQRTELSGRCRDHVVSRYSLDAMVARMADIYQEITGAGVG